VLISLRTSATIISQGYFEFMGVGNRSDSMAAAKRLLEFLRFFGLVALLVLFLSSFSYPAPLTPGPQGQDTSKNGAVHKGQPEPLPEETKPQNTPGSTEKWLEAIETTYKQSHEDLTQFIEIIHTVFEVLAVVLVILGIVLGIDVSKLHSQLRDQREAQKTLQKELVEKYAAFTSQLDQTRRDVQKEIQAQAKDIEDRLEKLVKYSEASVSAAQALVLRMNGRYDESIQCWDNAISLSPTAYHYWQRAYVLEAKSRFQESIDDCDTALGLQPRYLEARALKGYVLIKTQKYSDAVKELEAVLKEKGDDKNTIYNLAVAYGAIRDRAKVLEWLRRLKSYSDIEEFLADARAVTPHFAFLREDPDFKELVK
jgi:tetratricopeptide (TPR) repeat protein